MDALAARLSPAALSKALHPERRIAPHVRLISDRIRAHVLRENGASGRLIVCAPPGHAKTDSVSNHTPAWFLETRPGEHVILASATAQLAQKNSRIVRNILATHEDDLFARVAPDSSAVDMWHTADGSTVRAAGIGGLLSGFRAHLLVIDDPIADAKQANSETFRNHLWDWYLDVADTRCWPEATQIVMHTRWHQDDLVGRLLAQQEDLRKAGMPVREWELLSLPAIAEENDPLGRSPGAPLWPEKYPLDFLEEQRAKGSYRWAALYQQRPAPIGGAIFQQENFRRARMTDREFVLVQPDGTEKRVLKALCQIAQTCDTAMKTKTTNDWTVILTFAVTPEREIIVLGVDRDRIPVPAQLPRLKAQRQRWSPQWQGVEDKAGGTTVLQLAAAEGWPLRPLKADGDKVTRAMAAVAMYENGNVYHCDGPWRETFESELLGFPTADHDDQVDCIAYAALSISRPVPRVHIL